MANELKHKAVGIELTQAEYEDILGHQFDAQATGDILYASSATQLSRLAIGSVNQLLAVSGGLPAWATTLAGAYTFSGAVTLSAATLTTPTIAAAGFANMNHTHASAATGGLAGWDLCCRAYNSAAISIPNATDTALTFDSERFDTDTMHSTVTNTGRITFTTAGVYVVVGHLVWAANATGQRTVWIRLNGVTFLASLTFSAGAAIPHDSNVSTIYKFAATDYVEFGVYQDSGAALNVNTSVNKSPEFSAARVGTG